MKKSSIPAAVNRQNLLDILPALESVEAFVFYGTLLGLHREGDIIAHDDDIDILVNKKDHAQLLANLKTLGLEFGYWSLPQNTDFLQIARDLDGHTALADFYFYTAPEDKNYIIEKWNFFAKPENSGLAIHVPKHLVYPLVQQPMFDQEIPFPADPGGLCEFLYGKNWQKPRIKGAEYKMAMYNNAPLFMRVGNFTFNFDELSAEGQRLHRSLTELETSIPAQRAKLSELELEREVVRQALIELEYPEGETTPDAQPPLEELRLIRRLVLDADYEPAEQRCKSLLIEQRSPEVLHLLAAIKHSKRDLASAEPLIREAVSLQPSSAEIQATLGQILDSQMRLEEAVEAYEAALALRTDYVEVMINLGATLIRLGRYEASIKLLEQATTLRGDLAQAKLNLGIAYSSRGQIDQAVDALREAIAISPGIAQAHNALGSALTKAGCITEAIAAYRAALTHQPNYTQAKNNLLQTMLYDPDTSDDEVFEAHAENGRLLSASITPYNPKTEPLTNKRLRIGYISPDFRSHSVAFFIEPILAAHDTSKFEVFCFSDVLQEDKFTKRLKSLTANWHDVSAQSDAEVAGLIRTLQIDILVDLAGYSARNRLRVFCYQPAPVQATYLGYPGTTGIPAIKYRITDAVCEPDSENALYTEVPARVGRCSVVYKPPLSSPSPVEPPCRGNGYITFGSFNNIAKISDACLRAWLAILEQVPGARLIIKSSLGKSQLFAERIASALNASKIEAHRIEVLDFLSERKDHLALYNEVDIALDPFTYSGVTTTCEALWMGVPVISMRGTVRANRMGDSLLRAAGLNQFVASSESDYIVTAARLAADIHKNGDDRVLRRRQVQESVLMDAQSFTRNLETLYRTMWTQECAQDHVDGSDTPDKLDQAIRHLRQGDYSEAERILEAALLADPRNPKVIHMAGLTAVHLEKFEQAETYLSLELELGPIDPIHKKNILAATANASAGGYPAVAESLYRKLLRAEPANDTAAVRLCALLGKAHRLNDLEALVHQIEDDRSATYWLCRAVLHKLRNDEPAAQRALRQSLSLQPTQTDRAAAGVPKLLLVYGTESLPFRLELGLEVSFEIQGGHFNANVLIDPAKHQVTHLFLGKPDDLGTPLIEEHDIVINAIADCEVQSESLTILSDRLDQHDKPILNHPREIMRTSREGMHQLLKDIEGINSPPMHALNLPSDQTEAAALILNTLPEMPILIRPLGSSTGIGLTRVDQADSLTGDIARYCGTEVNVCPYVDFKSSDGYFRKFRLFFMGDAILPEHCVIHDHWNVHSSSRLKLMLNNEALQREERAFINNPRDVLSDTHWNALMEVRARVPLDYFGMDFSIIDDETLLLFEANAGMRVNPDYSDQFPYLDAQIQTLKNRFQQLIASKITPDR